MKTDLYYFGNFRQITKKSEENIELDDGMSIRSLLDILISRYPNINKLLAPEQLTKSNVLIVRGEKPVLNFGAKLKDGDQIYLFIMLAGG